MNFYHVFKPPMGRREKIWGLILALLENPFPISQYLFIENISISRTVFLQID